MLKRIIVLSAISILLFFYSLTSQELTVQGFVHRNEYVNKGKLPKSFFELATQLEPIKSFVDYTFLVTIVDSTYEFDEVEANLIAPCIGICKQFIKIPINTADNYKSNQAADHKNLFSEPDNTKAKQKIINQYDQKYQSTESYIEIIKAIALKEKFNYVNYYYFNLQFNCYGDNYLSSSEKIFINEELFFSIKLYHRKKLIVGPYLAILENGFRLLKRRKTRDGYPFTMKQRDLSQTLDEDFKLIKESMKPRTEPLIFESITEEAYKELVTRFK